MSKIYPEASRDIPDGVLDVLVGVKIQCAASIITKSHRSVLQLSKALHIICLDIFQYYIYIYSLTPSHKLIMTIKKIMFYSFR